MFLSSPGTGTSRRSPKLRGSALYVAPERAESLGSGRGIGCRQLTEFNSNPTAPWSIGAACLAHTPLKAWLREWFKAMPHSCKSRTGGISHHAGCAKDDCREMHYDSR